MKKKSVRNALLFTAAAVILTICWWIGGSEAAVDDISGHILRLHILANSDSEDDQALKLAVRDRVLRYVRESGASWDEAYLREHLQELTDVCRSCVREQGGDFPVHAELGGFYFPTKRYENIVLPAGTYRALRIIIGAGTGQNWWCVLYPPLCFTRETQGELPAEELERLRAGMSEASFQLIQADDEQLTLTPAFKLVEWWQKAKRAIAG